MKNPAGKIAVLHVLIFAFLVSHLDGKRFKTESSRGFPQIVPVRNSSAVIENLNDFDSNRL